MHRSLTACLLLLASTTIAACGGAGPNEERFSGEAKDVAAIVDQLQDYAHDGDGDRICKDLLTAQLSSFISKSYGKACGERVAEQLTRKTKITVKKLEVQGPLASATVTEQNGNVTGMAFVKREGDWRISRIQG